MRYSNAAVKLLQFDRNEKKGGAKNTAVLKKLKMESPFVKLGTFHKIRCYVWVDVWGAYQTPSPGTLLSNSLKKLCAPLLITAIY